MTLRTITSPVEQSVTLADAKAHLRIVGTDDDTQITAMIDAATEVAEQATGRALMQQTLEAGFDAFSAVLVLTRVPVQSVTSITYIDASGTLQTLAPSAYTLTQDDYGFAKINPSFGTTWPVARGDVDGVKVRFVAGYANGVPQSIKNGILLYVGSLYENRESETISSGSPNLLATVDLLFDRFKVYD